VLTWLVDYKLKAMTADSSNISESSSNPHQTKLINLCREKEPLWISLVDSLIECCLENMKSREGLSKASNLKVDSQSSISLLPVIQKLVELLSTITFRNNS
jgi:hypothetical protein